MMDTGQKAITTILWGMAVLGMLAMVGGGLWAKRNHTAQLPEISTAAAQEAAHSQDSGSLPDLYAAPQFSLLNQNNRTVTRETLHGSVWVAMVFFTECPGICPTMIGRLHTLQESVPDTNVKLVPFSVDPEHDTPEVLRQYATRIKADPRRWHFLTGTRDQMFAAAEGLKLAAAPAEGENPIVHSGKLLLIDRAGMIRGVYDHKDDAEMSRLANDASRLAGEAQR